MKVSREQVAENRRRILESAGRLFRERGLDSVSVAEVMRGAGLTHGAFYGYFRSKGDLAAAALGALPPGRWAEPDSPAAYADRYLTAAHRDDRAGGCPLAALGAEAVRQAPEIRAAMTESLRRQIARLSPDGSDGSRQAAVGGLAAMIGALVLARLSDDPALSDEVLALTRAWIAERAD